MPGVAWGNGSALTTASPADRSDLKTRACHSFGRAVWTNLYDLTEDRKRVSRFVAPTDGKVKALSVYIDGNGSGPGAHQLVRFVVYTDANGTPADYSRRRERT